MCTSPSSDITNLPPFEAPQWVRSRFIHVLFTLACYNMDKTNLGTLIKSWHTMLEKPARYRTYVLTAWEERSRNPDVPTVWRFSLLDPSTGRRRGFASLEVLAAALQQDLAVERSDDRGQE
jgi:hypothetical protein